MRSVNNRFRKSAKIKELTIRGESPFDFVQQAKAYETFLFSIAIGLGLTAQEAAVMAEETCVQGGKSFPHRKEKLTMRLWLSKLIIRKCIFKISSILFASSGAVPSILAAAPHCYFPAAVRKLPLSFQTVYILVRRFGFTEAEVAQLLNSTSGEIKERLAKAVKRLQAM